MICSRWENCYMECLKDARQSKCDNKNLQNCIVSNDCRDRITCRDSGKSYTLINTRKVKAVHYKVDGGVVVEDKSVPSDTRKCDDAIFLGEEKRIAVLIELKGARIATAIAQLLQTYNRHKAFLSSFSEVHARCATSGNVPNLTSTPDHAKLKRALGTKGSFKCIKSGVPEKDVDLSR